MSIFRLGSTPTTVAGWAAALAEFEFKHRVDFERAGHHMLSFQRGLMWELSRAHGLGATVPPNASEIALIADEDVLMAAVDPIFKVVLVDLDGLAAASNFAPDASNSMYSWSTKPYVGTIAQFMECAGVEEAKHLVDMLNGKPMEYPDADASTYQFHSHDHEYDALIERIEYSIERRHPRENVDFLLGIHKGASDIRLRQGKSIRQPEAGAREICL